VPLCVGFPDRVPLVASFRPGGSVPETRVTLGVGEPVVAYL
jgi:hypothetical protein